MPFLIEATIKAEVMDFDGSVVKDKALVKKLDGICCYDDTALNYLDDLGDTQGFRGGYVRLRHEEGKRGLYLSIEIDAPRKLNRKELTTLRENLTGQIFDGIGSGAFNDLGRHAGLQITHPYSAKVVCKQSEGKAWKPRATTAKSNDRRIAAIAKSERKLDKQKSVKTPTTSTKSAVKTKQPNFRKLLRLLDKVDREFIIPEIQKEVDAVGDLSGLEDRQFPTGNFHQQNCCVSC